MDTRLINIGFGNIVAASRIIAIVSPDSAPIKRIIQEARDKGILIDATYGRRTRAVVITDSGHVVLSAVQPETVAHRFTSKEAVEEDDEDIEEEPVAPAEPADPRTPRGRPAQAGGGTAPSTRGGTAGE
jgi:extracellular matrix regulatory protein A